MFQVAGVSGLTQSRRERRALVSLLCFERLLKSPALQQQLQTSATLRLCVRHCPFEVTESPRFCWGRLGWGDRRGGDSPEKSRGGVRRPPGFVFNSEPGKGRGAGYAPLLAHRFAAPSAGDMSLRDLPSESLARFCGVFRDPTACVVGSRVPRDRKGFCNYL